MRRLISSGPDGEVAAPSRREALELLTTAAREGNVAAMVGLARELRLEEPAAPQPVKTGPVRLEELEPGELWLVR